MKTAKRKYIILAVILCIMYYLLCGSPLVEWRNDRLAKAIQKMDSDTVTLEELVPFAWDAVYTFEPYTSKESIRETIGFFSPDAPESWGEYTDYIVFTKGNRIVSNPENGMDELGCCIILPYNGKDGGTGSVHYGEHVLFEREYGSNGVMFLRAIEKDSDHTIQ